MPNLAFKPFEPADYVGVAQGFARACALSGSPSPPRAPAAAATSTSGEEKEDLRSVGIPLLMALAAHLATARYQLPRGSDPWKPEHLSQLAAAFAAAGVRHDGLFLGPLKEASVSGPQGLSQFHPWALEELRTAYRKLGYKEAWL